MEVFKDSYYKCIGTNSTKALTNCNNEYNETRTYIHTHVNYTVKCHITLPLARFGVFIELLRNIHLFRDISSKVQKFPA